MSEDLERVSLKLPPELLEAIDENYEDWGYLSRDAAVRDAIRRLTEQRDDD